MQCQKLIIGLMTLVALTACQDTTFRSAVPDSPVRVYINTNEWEFVHFKPSNTGATLTIDKSGFHMNGKTMGLRPNDYCGYRGLVVIVDNNNRYSAFDCCCPHCVYEPDGVVETDGIYARCRHCGEEYDLSWGYGLPQHGIAKQALRKYTCIYSGDQLTISSH